MFGVCVWFQRHEVDLSKMWWKGLLWIRVVGKGAVGGGGNNLSFHVVPIPKIPPPPSLHSQAVLEAKEYRHSASTCLFHYYNRGPFVIRRTEWEKRAKSFPFFHTKKVPGIPLRTEALVHGLNFICFVFLMSASPTELLWTPLGQIYRYYWLIPYEESHTFILQGKKVDLQGNLRNGKWKNPKWHAHILNGKKLESTFM